MSNRSAGVDSSTIPDSSEACSVVLRSLVYPGRTERFMTLSIPQIATANSMQDAVCERLGISRRYYSAELEISARPRCAADIRLELARFPYRD